MIRLIRAHLAKAEQLTGCNEQDVISSYSDELAIELLNVEIESVKSRMLGGCGELQFVLCGGKLSAETAGFAR